MTTNPGIIADVVNLETIDIDWGNNIRDRVVNNYANVTDRDTAIPVPVIGQVCSVASFPAIGLALLQYVGATDGWRQPWNTPWGIINDAVATSNQAGITTIADLTSVGITWTAVANRWYRATLSNVIVSQTSGTVGQASITLDIGGAQVALQIATSVGSGGAGVPAISIPFTIAAGSHTVKARAAVTAGGGTMTTVAGATAPIVLLLEDIGPAGGPS